MSYAIKFNVAKAQKLGIELPTDTQKYGNRYVWHLQEELPAKNRWLPKADARRFVTDETCRRQSFFNEQYMDVIDLDTGKVVRPISDALGKAAADKRKPKVQQHVAGRYALKFNVNTAIRLSYILPLAIHTGRTHSHRSCHETWWSTQLTGDVLWTKVKAAATRFDSVPAAQLNRADSPYEECLDVIDLNTNKVVRVVPLPARDQLTAARIRKEWRAAGGSIHGPNVETVTMTEADYFKFRRSLAK